MKLDDFLSTALATGHTRVKLVSTARGHTVHRGELAGVTGGYLEQLALEDAVPLARDQTHEYVVTVESQDGQKESRFTVRVAGAAGPQDEHRVDPASITQPGQVVGHLVRMLVDERKEFVKLAGRLIDRDINETNELMRLRRSVARRGQDEITSKVLEMDAADRAADRERGRELWKGLMEMATPLFARVVPGGDVPALAKFRSSLSEAQLEQLAEILGAKRFGLLLTLDTPEKVAGLFIDCISIDEGRAIQACLTAPQQALIGAAIRAELERQDRAKKAAAAPASPSANGASS